MEILSENSYEAETFKHNDISGSKIRQAEFIECEFKDCTFTEAILMNCIFRDCLFKNCNLDLVQVDKSIFKSTQFAKCKMLGINWTRASWGRRGIAHLVKTINFQECMLNYSIFMGLNLTNLQVVECVAREVDFSETVLRKADFSGCDLERAIFRNSDLREANFSKARNYSIPLQMNKTSGARFSLPEALSLLYNMDIVLE